MSQTGRAAAAEGGASFVALCADELAFRAWYEHALPRVYGFVHARTGVDDVLAEEITAAAFMEAVRARASFQGLADPVTWICSIARNRLLDHYRREARDRAGHLRLVVADLNHDEERLWDDSDRREAVRSALASLPSLERNALILRYLDGFSVRETAKMIGRSEAATESLLTRARGRVRRAFPGGLE